MSDSHIKNNLKPQNRAHCEVKVVKRSLLPSFISFMLWIGIIGLLLSLVACQQPHPKQIASETNSGYDKGLSKNVSGYANRTPLAFFMLDNSVDSQIPFIKLSIAPKALLSAIRGYTLILMAVPQRLPANYDGMTLQNKTAVRQICRAVTNVTESEPRHPIFITYSVTSTQKTLGDGYHG